MARVIPYIFCRYQISVDEEPLDAGGQRQALVDMQGEPVAHGPTRDGAQPLALIMEPRAFRADGERALSWAVGYQPGWRVRTEYDREEVRKVQTIVPDPHIKYAEFVSLPEMGLLAVLDRASDQHIPARQAISAFRTLVRSLGEGLGSVDIQASTEDDRHFWLQNWALKEYSFTVSPLNPIRASDLAERRSEAMRRENIARESGKVSPNEGDSMRANGGVIQETSDLIAVGYGQDGFRGVTPDGHTAHVPKPKFYQDRHKNLREREKPHYVRVLMEDQEEEEQNDLHLDVARVLRRFFGQ